MNTQTQTRNVRDCFGEINSTLDTLIRCQRAEQEMVLSRNIANLPGLCDQINALALSLQKKQQELSQICTEVPADCQAIVRECKAKFSLLQELALQNHILIEHNLEYLQGIFSEVFGKNGKQDIYNALGVRQHAIGGTGSLLNVRV